MRSIVVLMLLVLTGCGFSLRQPLVLPEALRVVTVETPDPQDPLRVQLEDELRRAGAQVREPGVGVSTLRVSSPRLDTLPLSTDAGNRVLEFGLRYRADVQWLDAAGKPVIESRSIELDRDYRFDTASALGSPDEDELNREELVVEMSAAILRSLRVALLR